jgi:hypothetical protein
MLVVSGGHSVALETGGPRRSTDIQETTMTASTSLLAWIESLFRNPAAQAALQADPQGYAADHGFQNLSSADVHDALCLAADNRSASYDHDSSNHVQLPPPPAHYDHEDGAHYLRSYVSNNYTTIDEHNTNIDNSVHERVNTHGGDFSQEIHNDPVVASGDHSVATGGDIHDSTLTTGDRNVVGDNNQAATGDHNTTAFGSGDATNAHLDHSNFGDGGALSIGGNADGNNTHSDTTTSVHNSSSGATSVNAAGDHADAHQNVDQHQADDSTHTNYDDTSHTDHHDELNSHDNTHLADHHNTDIHHA